MSDDQSRRFTPELAVSLKIASDIQLAPDGSRVAWVVAPVGHQETQPTSAIWLSMVGGDPSPRPFTGGQAEDRMPRWSPDSRQIAFLSDRAERGTARVQLIEAQGGEARPLGELPGAADLLAWQPDGQALSCTISRRALAGEQKSPSEIKVYSEADRPQTIVRVPLDGGGLSVLGPAEGHVRLYAWSPDSRRLAVISTPTTLLTDVIGNVRLLILDASTRAERELATLQQVPASLEWSPDGTKLLLVAQTGDSPADERVQVIDVASGERTSVDPGESTPVWAGWLGDSSHALVLSQEGLWNPIDEVALPGGQRERLAPVPEGGTVLPPLSLSADGQTLAALRATPASPPDVWAGQLSGELRRLTNLNPQLENVELATMEPVEWPSSDGLAIQGWLLRPPGAATDDKLPLIVDIHGGPSARWGAVFHGTWHDWAQALAAAGYAVLLPNPRGSTGRGGAFTSANRSDLGGMDFQDIMAGVDHLIEQGIADPERMGVGGWSYGGFMTAWTIGHTDRFKAAVVGAGVINWPSKVGTTDIRTGNEKNFPGALHEQPDAYWERSPIRYLGKITTPTLVVHGEADPRVPVSQGYELYQGLRQMGVPTDFVTYPRQKHAFHEKTFQQDLLQRVVAWFQQWIPV